MATSHTTYALHFSGEVWSQIGSLSADDFDALSLVVEHYAQRAGEWLKAAGHPTVDECVPIISGRLIAECSFDDYRRTVTVERLEIVDTDASRAA